MDDTSDVVKAIERLGETIKGVMPSVGNSSTTTPTAATASPTMTSVAEFGKQLLGFGQAFGPAIAGLYSFADSTNAATRAISQIPGIGPATAEYIKATQSKMSDASKIGVGGGGPAQLDAMAARAGTTVEGFSETLKKSEGTLAGFGRNAMVGGDNFADVTQRMLESETGQRLIAHNMGTEEMKKYAVIVGMNSKANMSEAKSRENLAQSAATLAAKIDETSRITGKSRDSIADELDARIKSVDSQLAMNLMSEEQQAQFIKTQAQLTAMGTSIADAGANIASGQVLTDDTIKTLQALGPAGDEFQRAIEMQQSATDDASRQAADAALARAKQDIVTYQSSAMYSQLALSGGTEIAAQQKVLMGETAAYRNAQRAAQQDITLGAVTPEDAAAKQLAEVQAGQKGLTKEGAPIAGAEIMTEVNKGVEGSRKVAVAGAIAFEEFNNVAGKTPAIVNGVTEVFKLIGDSSKTTAQQKAQYDKLLKEGTDFLTGGEKTSAATKEPETAGSISTEPVKRKDGSFGATGSFMEDFGKETPALLHGKEGVITEDQLGKLLGSVKQPVEPIDISSHIDTISKQLKSEMPTLPPAKVPDVTKNDENKSIDMAKSMPDVKSMTDALTSTIKSTDMSNAVPNFNAITDGLTTSIKSTDMNKAMPNFETLADGLTTSIKSTDMNKAMPNFETLADGLTSTIKSTDMNKAMPNFETLADGLTSTMKSTDMNKAMPDFGKITDDITSTLGSFDISNVMPDFGKITDDITSTLGSFDMEKVMPDFGKITDDMTSTFDSFDIGKVMPDFGKITDNITSTFGSFDIGKVLPDFGSTIKKELSSTINAIDLLKATPDLNTQLATETKKQPSVSPTIEKIAEIKPEIKKPEPVVEPIVKPAVPIENAVSITIKDLHDDLIQLNMNIMKMVSHTENISDSSKKTAGYASESTGSRV